MARFLKAALIRDYQREQGEQALSRAKQQLDEAGLTYQQHIYAGDMVETIARAATELGVDEIVLSASNLNIVGGFDFHSVVAGVLRRVKVPVSVVNAPATDLPIEAAAASWQLRTTP